MRVLVAGPEAGDYFTHNVAHTLRRMGHEVFSDDRGLAAARPSLATRLAARAPEAFRRYHARVEYGWLLGAARAKRPHLTVICTRTLDPQFIGDLRKASGGLVICWFGDAPANIKKDHIVSGEYDAVFLKDRSFAQTLANLLGVPAHYLPEACNPDWHRPTGAPKRGEILVAGTMYGFRSAVVLRLLAAGHRVAIYGPRPPAYADKRIHAAHTGIYLDEHTKAAAFEAAAACLNTFAPAEGQGVNCRVFETCGSGGLLVSQSRESLQEFFDPGTEIAVFSTLDELLDSLQRLAREPRLDAAMRAAATRRAHGEHSYRSRLETLLRSLDLEGPRPPR